MPTTEYKIVGNHPIFKYITKIRYTKSAADLIAATLKRLGYEITISERSLLV